MPEMTMESLEAEARTPPWRTAWECARCHTTPKDKPPAPAADGALYCERCSKVVGALAAPPRRGPPAVTSPITPAPTAPPSTPAPTVEKKRRPCGCPQFGRHLNACPGKKKPPAPVEVMAPALEKPAAFARKSPSPPPVTEPTCVAITVTIPKALEAHLSALVATGLHGRSVRECAERMIARGVEVLRGAR